MMKKIVKSLFFFASISSFAQSAGDRKAIDACLTNWGKHPFGKAADVNFRVLSPGVKIMGIGGSDLDDSKATAKPELILVKPSVNVMSKSTFKLMNPKGWYCLKGTTAVLGSAQLELHCKASLAAADDSKMGILGAADNEGVAVLGSIRIKRLGCAK